jgi:hypothetical protein
MVKKIMVSGTTVNQQADDEGAHPPASDVRDQGRLIDLPLARAPRVTSSIHENGMTNGKPITPIQKTTGTIQPCLAESRIALLPIAR